MGKISEQPTMKEDELMEKKTHTKMLNISIPQGKCKLKPHWDTTNPLDWLKLKRLITPSVGKDMEKHYHNTADGNVK